MIVRPFVIVLGFACVFLFTLLPDSCGQSQAAQLESSSSNYDGSYSLHGSGSDLASQCLWSILDKLEARTKVPLKATYRGVARGSSGLEELLLMNTNDRPPMVHFAVADRPLSSEQYHSLQSQLSEPTVTDDDFDNATISPTTAITTASTTTDGVVQLPILLSTIGFYHSVPLQQLQFKSSSSEAAAAQAPKLHLTPCLLARILTRNITSWNDPDIIALNPNSIPSIEQQEEEVEQQQIKDWNPDIIVAVRLRGGSTTWAVTNYLRMACPESFPEYLVQDDDDDDDNTPVPWSDNFKRCQGSSGMIECLERNVGAIGYVESSAVAIAAATSSTTGSSSSPQLLQEVVLQNRAGTFLTSRQAKERGGVAAAAAPDTTGGASVFPSRADGDFGSVNLLNQPGSNTWPLVVMTYIYVRKNLASYIEAGQERTLLVAFLRSLQDESFIGPCRDEYGFTLASANSKELFQLTKQGIDMLENNIAATDSSSSSSTEIITPWIFEGDDRSASFPAVEGMSDFVISSKRMTITEVELNALKNRISVLDGQVQSLQAELYEVKQATAEIAIAGKTGGMNSPSAALADFSSDIESKVRTALALASLSFLFWVLLALYVWYLKRMGALL